MLQTKAQAGTKLEFTRIAIGDGVLPPGGDLSKLTALIHEVKSLSIVEVKVIGSGQSMVKTLVTNKGVTSGFYIREIGLFARDPDVGEILYCIANAGTIADFLPPDNSRDIVEEVINMITVVGNATTITAVIDGQGTVTIDQFNELKAQVDHQQDSSSKQTANLKHGLQVITTDRATPVNVLSIKGRTLVNLLGKDGNCEDVSKWLTYKSNLSLDTENKSYGLNAIKVIGTATGDVNTIATDKLLKAGKFYLLLADVKNGNMGGGVRVVMGATGSTYQPWYTGITYKPMYSKFASGASDLSTSVEIQGNPTAVGQNFYVDGVRLFEIDQATYSKIGVDPEYTGDKLAEKFPYVDSVQHLQNPVIKKNGKNLIPPFTEWVLHANAKAVESYKLQLDATAGSQTSKVSVPVIPNLQYTLSFVGMPSLGIRIDIYDGSNYLTTIGDPSQQITFTPTQNTVELWAKSTTAGIFTFTNPQLELSTVATPFEPQNNEYLYLQTKLASNADGTVCDSVFERDGRMFRLNRFKKDMILDGSLEWLFGTDGVGYKNVTLPRFADSLAYMNAVAVKYDGKILRYNLTAFTGADQLRQGYGDPTFFLSIADVDSGWGESYTPTAAEIQAYFYGWKMYNGSSGDRFSLYTGNAGETKSWYPIPYLAAAGGGFVTTLPTALAANFTPYKLTYQLANPVEEPISAEGSLSFHEGQNLVELGEGVIVRERTAPTYDSTNKKWGINGYGNVLSRRVGNILQIHKNGNHDDSWTITPHRVENEKSTKGAYYAFADSIDPTAVYEVTYLALDKYHLTSAAIEASIQYATSDKAVLNEVVQQVSDNEDRLSVVETTFARKQQGQWIAPALMGGWVNQDTGFGQAGYYKDEFGIVRLKGVVKSGAIGSTVFVLPAGYRPALSHTQATVSNNGSADVLGRVVVQSDGKVSISTGSNIWVSLDSITFRSEQ